MPRKRYTKDQEAQRAYLLAETEKYKGRRSTMQARIKAAIELEDERNREDWAKVLVASLEAGLLKSDVQQIAGLRNWDRFQEVLKLGRESFGTVGAVQQDKPEVVNRWGWHPTLNPADTRAVPMVHVRVDGVDYLLASGGADPSYALGESSSKVKPLRVMEIAGEGDSLMDGFDVSGRGDGRLGVAAPGLREKLDKELTGEKGQEKDAYLALDKLERGVYPEGSEMFGYWNDWGGV